MSSPSDALTRTIPHNLPLALSNFIGRERALAEVKQLLASARLLTLTGAGGCGKTRLALRAASDLLDQYADGVWWVELAPLADSTLIPQSVAKAMNVVEQPGHSPMELVLEHVRDKQMLLLLDNCEHLHVGCGELAQIVLSAAPLVGILATSRGPLAVSGEILYPVSPLALPPRPEPEYGTQRSRPSIDELLRYDAIRMFVERARACLPQFAPTQDSAASVVEICRRLDGIPLAIELAAARVNVLSVEQIAARLDDRFALLTTSARVAPAHHQTLRAAMDWSYDLLSEPEQALLRRMTVFSGGCTLDAVESVCADAELPRVHIFNALSSLVNKSLVVAETLRRGHARYGLLETIRQYAQEKSVAEGEWAQLRDRHLAYNVQAAEEAAQQLHGPYEQLWLNWLDAEYDNLRLALDWTLQTYNLTKGLELAIAIYAFWQTRGYLQEGTVWLERLLAGADDTVPVVVHAHATVYAGLMAALLGDAATAQSRGEEAIRLAEGAGEQGKAVLALALLGQGAAARSQVDYSGAFHLFARSVQLFREVDDSYHLSFALTLQANAATGLGQFVAARALLDESLALARELGNRYRIALTLNFLGDVARCELDAARAAEAYEESLFHLREIGATRDIAGGLHNLGYACLHRGDISRAHALFIESMELQRTLGNIQGMAECLTGFAAIAIARQRPAQAARLLAAAAALGGANVTSNWPAERIEYEQASASARTLLGDQEFATAQSEGRTLSMEQAIEAALALPSPDVNTKRAIEELTSREYGVAALIGQGSSNSAIAEKLVLSKRTVEKHIANILSKLGFSSRAQIVRWAIENGLSPTQR